MEQNMMTQEKSIQRAMSSNFPFLEACSSQCFRNNFKEISHFEQQCLKSCATKDYSRRIVV